MEKRSPFRDEAIFQHPVLLFITLALGFILMDPFHLGPLGDLDYRPVKHAIAPYKQVMERWPRDNRSRLGYGKLEFVNEVYGPESLEFDRLGRGPYTGLADGRVVRWMGEGIGWETFAIVTPNWSEKLCANGVDSTMEKQSKLEHRCGRPLGLRFDRKTGDLYIADAYYGLLVVGPEGGLATPLATHVEGKPILFANDLDIHTNGSIFFTDTSKRHNRLNHFFILLEGEATGRLLRYDPPTKTTHIVMDGLAFPNGVQLSKDESFLLFTETTNCRLMKYWLEGPKTGNVDVLADLPGFPDNVRLNEKGQFWVAIDCCRTPAQEILSHNPWIKRIYFRLPFKMNFLARLMGMDMYTVISLFNEKGEILEVLEDQKGEVMKLVSEVKENDRLVLRVWATPIYPQPGPTSNVGQEDPTVDWWDQKIGYAPSPQQDQVFATCIVSDQRVALIRRNSLYNITSQRAGPAGLSAAIRLKQMCREKNVDLSVCVVEKGAEVGAHIISGNVFEPRALNELLPQWKEEEAPINVPVTSDKFLLLTKDHAFSLPAPFNNEGNYVISLSQLVRWMGNKAEELGVEIYPGFAASEILYDANHKVIGIGTNDMGIAKDGSKRENFQRGCENNDAGRITLLAEGCRGSISEKIIRDHRLREKGQAQHQTYALGIKEVWEIDERKHNPGSVLHTLGWPLDRRTYGGSFLYHMNDRQVSLGLVVALNYKNPFLNPYEEFQRLKHHPAIKPLLEGGTVLQYGARTLNEGGFQSIPHPVFPGGAIIGCSAGFLNVPKIKGTHTAMKSGMLAAESAFGVLYEGSSMETYWDNLKKSWVWEELHKARNYRPAFEYGLIPGLALSAVEHYILKGRSPLTLKHGKPDHEATDDASLHAPIPYSKPDGVVSFDVPTSLYRSNTNHEHDQPAHLRLRDQKIPELVNLPKYAGPESRYCPARVYEYVPDEEGQQKLQINAQNCLHCKACDIKDPKQNIEWTVPEGGGGPGYSVM
ncbi:Electron transfer flavoprotein-ubiquinone oxidoreductase [Macleaya cordata]|uniref:Electron transfer flavoprotein-ubiquinone oxidoreductase, mitochondrial n=1 Tax=Macleaya cordata TaxID=56857 RepID=A0A200QEC5_MACCD|nr:Electron transfer flavoprotein-ubiquinone oxidoreductase [Macleaya cordata]